jgi:hypothetical protein
MIWKSRAACTLGGRRNAPSRCSSLPWGISSLPWGIRSAVDGVEPIRQVLKQMAQPPSGTLCSGRAAVPPESGDEGDRGGPISCAAALATVHESTVRGVMPRSCCADREVPRLPDLAPFPASCA